MKRAILLLLLFLTPSLFADKKILNIYNWANYMPHSIIHQFEKETGIHINYSEYDSNEMMYAKLKTNPKLGYDIIVPSSYYVRRLANEGMLYPLDKSKIPNISHFNPILMNRDFDPGNQYSLPYVWGATGIVVNDQYFDPKQFHLWPDLWNNKYRNQLLILDDMREVFSIALITLGYSVNDTDPKHIKQAYEKLRLLLPNIKLFNSDAEENIYVDEDATLGIGWNGEIFQAHKENPHLHFIYPDSSFVLWIDCIAIPRHAPHIAYAEAFINFIARPDIAAKIAIYNGFSSPNLSAIKLQPAAMQQSPILNPSNEILSRAVMEDDLGDANAIYEKYWELLKLGS